jgi:hypothetical protein
MIRAFRHIALGGSTRNLSGIARVGAHLARLGSLITILIFFADTVNADILYAAIAGQIRFEDNPLILDSATDSTSIIPDIARPHVNYFQLAKLDGGAKQLAQHSVPRFFGTTITEDEDSPTVLDGATTQSLTFVFQTYFAQTKIDKESAVPTLDRTITYGRLLI